MDTKEWVYMFQKFSCKHGNTVKIKEIKLFIKVINKCFRILTKLKIMTKWLRHI